MSTPSEALSKGANKAANTFNSAVVILSIIGITAVFGLAVYGYSQATHNIPSESQPPIKHFEDAEWRNRLSLDVTKVILPTALVFLSIIGLQLLRLAGEFISVKRGKDEPGYRFVLPFRSSGGYFDAFGVRLRRAGIVASRAQKEVLSEIDSRASAIATAAKNSIPTIRHKVKYNRPEFVFVFEVFSSDDHIKLLCEQIFESLSIKSLKTSFYYSIGNSPM